MHSSVRGPSWAPPMHQTETLLRALAVVTRVSHTSLSPFSEEETGTAEGNACLRPHSQEGVAQESSLPVSALEPSAPLPLRVKWKGRERSGRRSKTNPFRGTLSVSPVPGGSSQPQKHVIGAQLSCDPEGTLPGGSAAIYQAGFPGPLSSAWKVLQCPYRLSPLGPRCPLLSVITVGICLETESPRSSEGSAHCGCFSPEARTLHLGLNSHLPGG